MDTSLSLFTFHLPEKAARAEAEIRGGLPGAALELVPLDLGSLASVRASGSSP